MDKYSTKNKEKKSYIYGMGFNYNTKCGQYVYLLTLNFFEWRNLELIVYKFKHYVIFL